jgi:hypothetical protein
MGEDGRTKNKNTLNKKFLSVTERNQKTKIKKDGGAKTS